MKIGVITATSIKGGKGMLVMVAMLDCAVMGEQGKSCYHCRCTISEEDVTDPDFRLVKEIKEQEKEIIDFSENPQEDCELESGYTEYLGILTEGPADIRALRTEELEVSNN